MKTKHILISLGIATLAVGTFFGIRYYRNNKKKKDADKMAKDEAQMKKEEAERKLEELKKTPTNNAHMTNVMNAGFKAFSKSSERNFVGDLAANDWGREKFAKMWKDAKPTMYEYNLMMKYFNYFYKNADETYKQFTNNERVDLKKAFTRLEYAD